GALRLTEWIDLVIQLEIWYNRKAYETIGLEDEFTEILDSKLPIIRIPVKPGRNLAIIIESAAMNNRQKKMGYNAAKALTDRVMGLMDGNGG
ncbi:MAG: HPr kinase/phosphorylase, partial [Oscillospiraceae bacterium]|nr:HPr kinase/phosphorylase [Oscillospiraceae bacterium]